MTRGERVCAFIETHLRVPEGRLVGQPFRLAPFQVKFILDIYDNPAGTLEAFLSIGKKNGKTGLIAGLVLAHLVGPEAIPNTEIISGAMSRDQAAQVYRYASKSAVMSPDIDPIVKAIPSKKMLVGLNRNVEYHAQAAEAGTTQGVSPVLAILDELGEVRGPRSEFVEAIVTSQGAHDSPLLIGISTQAPTDADMWSLWLDDARGLREGTEPDPHTVCHVYEAPKGCDLMDESAWKQANPALDLFRSRRDLERLAKRAVRMPAAEPSFRRLNLNQRVSAMTSVFVTETIWKNCGAEPAPLQPDVPTYGGLDLSARTDLTALELIQWDEDAELWHVHSYYWAPADGVEDRARRDRVPYEVWGRKDPIYLRLVPGKTVDYEVVARDILEIIGPLEHLEGIAFDRWRMDVLRKEFERLGVQESDVKLIPHGQGYKDMSPALDELEADLLNGRLAHGNHPILTWNAANAVVKTDEAGNRKLDKAKAVGRIDGLVALAMARAVPGKLERDELAGPSVYETRGFREL